MNCSSLGIMPNVKPQANSHSKNKNIFFTICAPNYLHKVSILYQSLIQNCPDSFLYVLLVQDCEDKEMRMLFEKEISTQKFETLQILGLSEVDWSDNFNPYAAANKYDLNEFCTSVKPSFFLYLFSLGHQRVTYLDPDIQVFGNLLDVIETSYPISLTPHILSDYPIDMKLPNAITILNAGTFNLGFISANRASIEFMRWWEFKLNTGCYMRISKGFHVDQKWMDLAPSLMEVQIIKNIGFNVAYWNLHERKLISNHRKYFVRNKFTQEPLYFFHFSGLTEGPNLSKHSTRTLVRRNDLVLQQLIENYKTLCKESFPKIINWTFNGRNLAEPSPEAWRELWLEEDLNGVMATIRIGRFSKSKPRLLCQLCRKDDHKFLNRSQNYLNMWMKGSLITRRIKGTRAKHLDFEFK